MEPKAEERIMRCCGRLITGSGTGGFTFENLSQQPELEGIDIYNIIQNEEDIFKLILRNLEKELKILVEGISSFQDGPAEEIELLFKRLHQLFKQKPYYLELIFDKELRQEYHSVDKIISRIKKTAVGYLTGLINRGKEQKVFTSKINTTVLVKKILGSFRAMMNDLQLAGKMVRDLKKYQSVTD